MGKFIFGAAVGFVAGAVSLAVFAVNQADKAHPGSKKMLVNAAKKTIKEIIHGE